MSTLFKQINEMGAQQRQQIEQLAHSPTLSPARHETPIAEQPAQSSKTEETPLKSSKKVVPQSGATAPHSDTAKSAIDTDKLRTIIQELSQMPVGNNGLNVRMSEQEMVDIEEFVYGSLRKEGLKGYDVSIAKLMRYSLRYLFRVHPKEFVHALKEALKVEEKLSI